MHAKRIRASLAAVAVAATLTAPSVAHAGGGKENITEGACSGAATWKLKVAEQDNRVEVEFEVDANVVGQQWRVAVWHDGQRVSLGTYRTAGLSGSFSVESVEPDRAGADVFRARAIRIGVAGQHCLGGATF